MILEDPCKDLAKVLIHTEKVDYLGSQMAPIFTAKLKFEVNRSFNFKILAY